MEPKWISTGVAARILNVNQRTVQRMAKARMDKMCETPNSVRRLPNGRYELRSDEIHELRKGIETIGFIVDN